MKNLKQLIAGAALVLACFGSLAQGTAPTAATQVVAHRGYWKAAQGAQNSLEAYSKADSIGAFGSEFDVWLTADDSLVVNHDRHFCGVDFKTSPTDSIMAITLKNGEPLPTLDSYLAHAKKHPGVRPVLELKPLAQWKREDLAAEKVVDALKKHDLLDKVDIISFSINACMAFKKLAPEVPVYYLDSDLPPRKLAYLQLAGLDYNGSSLKAHPEWVEDAHKRGLKVNVWTIDKEEDMRLFRDMGVDYITTNNPELLQRILAE